MPVWRKEHEAARTVVHYIGIVSTVICLLALIGQIFHQPTLYTWGHYGAMSFPTACVCVAFGIGFFLVSRGEVSNVGGGR
jgi:hypothetical protein